MRSCASRGARSPGSARNRSSCSRSEGIGLRADIGNPRAISAYSAGIRRAARRMPLGGQHGPARIGGRGLGAAVGPGLQIVDRVDDTAAELSIGRTGAVGPVLLQRAGGQAEEIRRLPGCAGSAAANRRDRVAWVGPPWGFGQPLAFSGGRRPRWRRMRLRKGWGS